MMKLILLLALLAILPSCGFPPIGASGRGFWDQSVVMTGWGLNMVTPYGPVTFGYLSWQRNAPKFTPADPDFPNQTPR